jgi:MinD-like ATPase involved in chromosome partitioning or flagellar assembly
MDDRRRPARPPWLLSGEVQPREISWPQHVMDAPERPSHPPASPTSNSEGNDARQSGELTDQEAPHHRQPPGPHSAWNEHSHMRPPRQPGLPVDARPEPTNHTRLSDVAHLPVRAERDVHREPSSVWDTAGEQPAAQPVDPPSRHTSAESPPRPQGSGLRPPAAPPPLEAPLPPQGWPPGARVPPNWWPPPPLPGWPDVPAGVPPQHSWQYHFGDGAQLPPTKSYKSMSPPKANALQGFRMAPSLEAANLVDPRKYAPQSGWRRAVHRLTRGHVNPGLSRKAREKESLLAQIRQPLAGDFRIAVLSIKGGVGKTTTTLGLGSALAMVRPDRVIAVDANPDRGTLAERVRDASTKSTVRDLLTDPNVSRYGDIRGHTRMAVSRLEVLASEQDPAAADIFDEADYRRTIDILGRYYNVILTDCGTGIMHSAMAGVLDLAHSLVLVSAPAIDAIRSASATLDWLIQHGHSGLVREGHLVLSAARPRSTTVKLDKVNEFFEARCRSIHFIPFDPHLAEGADVDFKLLKPATHQAYLELAGAVAQSFPRLRADRECP